MTDWRYVGRTVGDRGQELPNKVQASPERDFFASFLPPGNRVLACSWLALVTPAKQGLMVPFCLERTKEGEPFSLELKESGGRHESSEAHPFKVLHEELEAVAHFLNNDLGLMGTYWLHAPPTPLPIRKDQLSWQLPLYYAARAIAFGLLPRLDIALTGELRDRKPESPLDIDKKADATLAMGLKALVCPGEYRPKGTIAIVEPEGVDAFYEDYWGDEDPLGEHRRSAAQRASDREACLTLKYLAAGVPFSDRVGKMDPLSVGLPGPRIQALAAGTSIRSSGKEKHYTWNTVVDYLVGLVSRQDSARLTLALTPGLKGLREAVYFQLRRQDPNREVILDLDGNVDSLDANAIRLSWGQPISERPGPFFFLGDACSKVPAGFRDPIAFSSLDEAGCEEETAGESRSSFEAEEQNDLYPIDLAIIHAKLSGHPIPLPEALVPAFKRRVLVSSEDPPKGNPFSIPNAWRLGARTTLGHHLRGPFEGRDWLFKRIDDFTTKQKDPLLLLRADPGWGKSRFAAELINRNARVVAYHFFDSGDHYDVSDLCRSLIVQLADRFEEVSRALEGALRQGEIETPKSAETLFREVALRPLERLVRPPSLVILDSLDAANYEQRNFLEEIHADLPPGLRIIATSRPDANVESRLYKADQPEPFACNSPENLEDLRRFVEGQLQDDTIKRHLAQENLAELSRAIQENGGGLFVYAHFILEAFRDGNILKPSEIPKGLSALFARWFSAHFREDFPDDYHNLLGLLCTLREDPPIDLLGAFLGWTPTETKRALQKVEAFFPQNSDKTYRAYHPKVREWLLGQDRDGDMAFCIDERKIHELIIETCRPEGGWGAVWLEHMNSEP